MSTVQAEDFSATIYEDGTTTATITPGSYTVFCDEHGWVQPPSFTPEQAFNYYFDMYSAYGYSPGQIPTEPFQIKVEGVAVVVRFPDAAPVLVRDTLPPAHHAALLARSTSQVQGIAAPYAASPQAVGQHMAPTQHAGAGPSTPAPQHAGTKRARVDSTSPTAVPKAKKAMKEKKAKQPRILNSGLRAQPVAVADAAATTPSGDNTTTPSLGETAAVEQQQH